MDDLSELLKKYELQQEPFNAAEISDQLRYLAEKNPSLREESAFQAESLAFNFAEGAGETSYYGPFFRGCLEDGTLIENPSISSVNEDILEYWRKRSQQAQHPFFRLRYADLVWDLTKLAIATKPEVKFAREVVDQTIALCERAKPFKYPSVEGKFKLSRALNVALQVSDIDCINRVIDEIIKFEDLYAEDEKLGSWGFSYDLLIADKKVFKFLAADIIQHIIEKLEKRFDRLKDLKIDVYASNHAVERICDYYINRHVPQDRNQVKKFISIYTERVLQSAKHVHAMVAESWLRELLKIYHKFGLDKTYQTRVLRAIQELPPANLHAIEASTKIPAHQYNKYVETFLGSSLTDALRKIGSSFFPRLDQTRQTVQEHFRQNPLSFLMSTTIQDKQGRSIAVIKPLPEDLDSHILFQMAQSIAMYSEFLNDILNRIFSTFKATTEDIVNYLFSNSVFAHPLVLKRKNVIEKGITFFIGKDYYSAVHLLIPQIEHILRTLMDLQGGTTYRLNQDEGFQFITLKAILDSKEIMNYFDDNLISYLKLFYIIPFGWNLRNNVCHGLIEFEEITESIANRVFQTLILFSLIHFEQKNLNDFSV